MKPLHLLVLLLFLAGAVWALTRSERAVREIQCAYYGAIGPFLRSGSALETKARAFREELRTSQDLERELGQLRDQVGRLRLIEERHRELEEENARLRRALGFKENAPFDVVTARVIRRQPSTWWQTVIIDRGEESGIGVQLPVVSHEGLVGKIDQPVDRMSTVILLTDAKCQVSARIEGTGEAGILGGQRGMAEGTPLLRLRFLDKNAAVRPGMRVLTTGRGGLFPAHLMRGTVESFEPGAFDAEALVRPAVDFMNLETVFVVMKKPEKS
jgi:rod shape-determining protein MreC